MNTRLSKLAACLLLAVTLCAGKSSAHIFLIEPPGADTLEIGSTVRIAWRVLAAHGHADFDLDYSLTGENGPWFQIARDLLPGTHIADGIYDYNWVVPNAPSDNVRLRVIQDNLLTQSYYSLNYETLTITTLDSDLDGLPNYLDNCPYTDNIDQVDSDSDSVGDACDLCPGFDDALDDDFDSMPNDCDVCPGGDDFLDTDGDGIPNFCDICSSGDDSTDADSDGIADACDLCPGFDDALDIDSDGVPDNCDNCPEHINPDQIDSNSDGIGDVCQACCRVAGDADYGGSVTIGDVTYLITRIFSGGPPPACCQEGDADGSGSITIADVTYLIAHIFGGGPAPICGIAGMEC